ncbi:MULTISPECIES: STAS domain-containing protein [Thiorhodovibrio]|uniref:STAS domain-containing protein n=1 Tax=Thiorhodovibrio TaxID=61593 RepID=UPI00191131AC|nr:MULTISPECIES: STAS domain-containing protein [Thiorhodovibrio]MBK5967948.1 hypothetical protein [Thiorhodovibrio winogradskyi]WPL11763.1 hypothetical protein Thiosp_01515 [Thiorhodovibrio litoralis]
MPYSNRSWHYATPAEESPVVRGKPLERKPSGGPTLPPSASQLFNEAPGQGKTASSHRRPAQASHLAPRPNSGSRSATRETLWVRTGSRLDIASLAIIQEAIHSVRVDQHHTESLVIDMKNTRQVFDSGIELLLFLYRKAGTRRNNLYIVNAGSRVRERLGEKGLDACFHLPKSPLNRPAGN